MADEVTYVRLRGSPEIHLSTCAKVARADPEGVVPADKEQGPPAYCCRRKECVAYNEALRQKFSGGR